MTLFGVGCSTTVIGVAQACDANAALMTTANADNIFLDFIISRFPYSKFWTALSIQQKAGQQ
jgi:hypothetical protein